MNLFGARGAVTRPLLVDFGCACPPRETITDARLRLRLSRNQAIFGHCAGPEVGSSVVVAGVHVEAGNAFAPEHLHVAAVVLEGEAELEPGRSELPDA